MGSDRASQLGAVAAEQLVAAGVTRQPVGPGGGCDAGRQLGSAETGHSGSDHSDEDDTTVHGGLQVPVQLVGGWTRAEGIRLRQCDSAARWSAASVASMPRRLCAPRSTTPIAGTDATRMNPGRRSLHASTTSQPVPSGVNV